MYSTCGAISLCCVNDVASSNSHVRTDIIIPVRRWRLNMQRTSWLAVCILLQELLWTRTIAQTVTAQACFQTDDQIRSSFASMYSEVVINCLSVAPSGSVNKVILSAFNSSNNVTARFTVTCVGSVLVSIPSPLIANRSSIGRGCSVSCVDTNQPCSARESRRVCRRRK